MTTPDETAAPTEANMASDAYWQEPLKYLMTAETYDRDAVMQAAQIMRNEIERLQSDLTPLRTMKATIEADSVTCPLCEGKPLGLGEFCYASCRDGKVLQTSANVLRNVRLVIDENDRLQAELAALRSAQQWRGIESGPDATLIDHMAKGIQQSEQGGPLGYFADGSPMRDTSWNDYDEDQHEEFRSTARAVLRAISAYGFSVVANQCAADPSPQREPTNERG